LAYTIISALIYKILSVLFFVLFYFFDFSNARQLQMLTTSLPIGLRYT